MYYSYYDEYYYCDYYNYCFYFYYFWDLYFIGAFVCPMVIGGGTRPFENQVLMKFT